MPSGKERAKDQRAPVKSGSAARISKLRNGLIAQGVMMAPAAHRPVAPSARYGRYK